MQHFDCSSLQVVFVASNFIGENGDMAIIDDIEVMYDASGPECQNDQHVSDFSE